MTSFRRASRSRTHSHPDSSSALALYAGRYGTENEAFNVGVEGDHLSVVENGKPKRELFPQTWSIFFSKDRDETFTFLSDFDTRAFRILREVGGKDDLIPILDPAP